MFGEIETMKGTMMQDLFDRMLAKYDHFINSIASRCKRRDSLNDYEDLRQELLMVLWNCCLHYNTVDEDSFGKLFNSSMQKRLAKMMTKKNFEKFAVCSDYNSIAPSGKKFVDGMVKHEMTEKDYQAGINELIKDVDDETAMTVLDVVNPENRGRHIENLCPSFRVCRNVLIEKV